MRLFFGIALPDPVRTAMQQVVDTLRSSGANVRWVPSSNFHVTMVFLGNVADDRASAVAQLSDAAVTDVPSFDLSWGGVGSFPTGHRPRVVWMGLQEPVPALMQLHQQLATGCRSAGFTVEDRPFHPHVTIGRVRSEKRVQKLVNAMPCADVSHIPPCRATQLTLFRSQLSSAGAQYELLHESAFMR